jgi:predicted nucleotidyltransferase
MTRAELYAHASRRAEGESATAMKPTTRWRQLLDDRLHEAVTVLGRIPGVHGLIVGGSVGRGDPWPMSDIDLLPIYSDSTDPATELEQHRAEIVDWWAASGRAQTLDVGWLAFTTAEIHDAMAAGPDQAAAHMADPRWFHGLDKAYGGRAANAHDDLSTAFAAWITSTRFHPAVIDARIGTWHQQATDALAEATGAEPSRATYLLRESARALRLVLVERWGERLGSMGREWTLFERMADRHGERSLAAKITSLAGADRQTAAERATLAPAWLQERIDLSYGGRRTIGEDVSQAENARDQLTAFTVHVARHRPDLEGPWTGTPDAALDAHLAELQELVARLH